MADHPGSHNPNKAKRRSGSSGAFGESRNLMRDVNKARESRAASGAMVPKTLSGARLEIRTIQMENARIPGAISRDVKALQADHDRKPRKHGGKKKPASPRKSGSSR